MSKTLESCEVPFTGWYLEFTIAIPIFMGLQLSLLCLTLCHEWKNRHNEMYHETNSKLVRTLYILLQVFGLCWMITDLFRMVIHQQVNILQSPDYIGCKLAAHVPKFLPVPFYAVYLYQILLRMKASFHNTYLAMTNNTIYILTALIFIPISLGYVGFVLFELNEKVCIRPWNITDIDEYLIQPHYEGYCDVEVDFISQAWYGASLCWVPILNAIFCIIFAYKLRQLLSKHYSDTDEVKMNIKLLILKVGILTLTGSIITALCYAGWFFFTRATFLYFNIYMNCLMLGLMFTYGDKYYKRSCKCCIILFLGTVDPSKTKMETEEVFQYADSRNASLDSLDSLSKMALNGEEGSPEILPIVPIHYHHVHSNSNVNLHHDKHGPIENLPQIIENMDEVKEPFNYDGDRLDFEEGILIQSIAGNHQFCYLAGSAAMPMARGIMSSLEQPHLYQNQMHSKAITMVADVDVDMNNDDDEKQSEDRETTMGPLLGINEALGQGRMCMD